MDSAPPQSEENGRTRSAGATAFGFGGLELTIADWRTATRHKKNARPKGGRV
jgi:hypothetical protein